MLVGAKSNIMARGKLRLKQTRFLKASPQSQRVVRPLPGQMVVVEGRIVWVDEVGKMAEVGGKEIEIDDVDEETFRDAKSIIELLKENISLWKEEEEGDNAVEDL